MKKTIITVLFLLQCIFLFGGRNQIYFDFENRSTIEIIVSCTLNPEFFPEGISGRYGVMFLSEDGKEIYASTNARNMTMSIVPEEGLTLMNIIKSAELLNVTPLEMFNRVIASFTITDTNGNILLTEKDITNDSFVRDSWVHSDGTEGHIIFTLFFTLEEYAEKQPLDPNLKLPLEERITLFFEHYKDDFAPLSTGRFAEYTVFEFGDQVIPYLKEYVENSDFFGFTSKPKDVTLALVIDIIHSLHRYTDPVYDDIVEPYTFNVEDIQWFVDQYMQKLDEFIISVKKIDETVLLGAVLIYYITAHKPENYGYQYFFTGDTGRFDIVAVQKLQEYYQERLDIEHIPITADGYEE